MTRAQGVHKCAGAKRCKDEHQVESKHECGRLKCAGPENVGAAANDADKIRRLKCKLYKEIYRNQTVRWRKKAGHSKPLMHMKTKRDSLSVISPCSSRTYA